MSSARRQLLDPVAKDADLLGGQKRQLASLLVVALAGKSACRVGLASWCVSFECCCFERWLWTFTKRYGTQDNVDTGAVR